MAENKKKVDLKREKNKADVLKALKKFRVLIAVSVLVLALVIIYMAMGEIRRSNITDLFAAIPKTIGANPGYPYSEDELSLDRVMLIGDKPLIVSDDGVDVISQEASKLLELHLDWADTRVTSFNGRAFVYSNTTGKAYLISRTKVLETFNEESTIKTGTVGKNGTVALSYETDKAQSVVKVYSTSKKLKFEWHCSKEYVSSLALSESGDKVVASAIGVNNAELYSRIILFKTNSTNPIFDKTFEGTTFLKVFISPGGKIVAVGDNKTVILNSKGEQVSEVVYADDSLYYIDSDSKGTILVCYKEFGGTKIKALVIPSSGKEIKGFELDYMPESADIRGTKVAFSYGSTVTIYSTSGEQKKVYECSADVSTVLLTGQGIYTLENGSVCKYS